MNLFALFLYVLIKYIYMGYLLSMSLYPFFQYWSIKFIIINIVLNGFLGSLCIFSLRSCSSIGISIVRISVSCTKEHSTNYPNYHSLNHCTV